MMAHRRAIFSFALGLGAAGGPALVWAFIVARQLTDPGAFHDQGGMFISFFMFPLALLVALMCGVPSVILGITWLAADDGRGRGLMVAGIVLCVIGLLLALGRASGRRCWPRRCAKPSHAIAD